MTQDELKDLLRSMVDNTAPRERFWELGIFKFAKFFFPDRFKDDFAVGHYDMVMLLFMLLDPQYEYMTERQAYLLIHREASKTTIGTFLFPIFLIYFKGYPIKARVFEKDFNSSRIIDLPPINENFILIASQTTRMAENFVVAIRDEITYRGDMASIFGEKNPREINLDDDRQADKMWRRAAFVTADNTIIIGIGSGQQARGTNLFGNRPVFAIIDDMYSANNIKTEQSREGIRYWFHAELLNSLDSRRGKCLWLGTLLHPDTVVKDFQKDPDWFGVNRPLISVEELATVVDECTVDGVYQRKEKLWYTNRQKTLYTLSWDTRHNLYSIMLRYEKALKQGRLNGFYQEFMNEYLAPETKMITPTSFFALHGLNIYKEKGVQRVTFSFDNIEWHGNISLSIGLDMASSVSDTSDDTVITVAGYARCYPRVAGIDWQSQQSTMKEGRIFPIIAHIEGGKYAIHNYQNMKGMCETLENLINIYEIDTIKMEANGQQEQIAREIDSYLNDKGHWGRVWTEYVTTNKADRILSILLPIIQKYENILCIESPLVEKLYFQTLTVGMSDHDDYADSVSIAFKNSNPPPSSHVIVANDNDTYKTRQQELYEQFGSDAWMYQ